MPYLSDYLLLKGILPRLEAGTGINVLLDGTSVKVKGTPGKNEHPGKFGVYIPFLGYYLDDTAIEELASVSIVLQRTGEQLGKFQILSRETVRNSKKNYENKINLDWYRNPENSILMDCSLKYTEAEMNWIRVGISPLEMEDRVIMFVDEDDSSINFFSSWQDTGLWKGFFRPDTGEKGGYEVYRLIAAKRQNREGDDLLSGFTNQLQGHFDTLGYIQHEQLQYQARNIAPVVDKHKKEETLNGHLEILVEALTKQGYHEEVALLQKAMLLSENEEALAYCLGKLHKRNAIALQKDSRIWDEVMSYLRFNRLEYFFELHENPQPEVNTVLAFLLGLFGFCLTVFTLLGLFGRQGMPESVAEFFLTLLQPLTLFSVAGLVIMVAAMWKIRRNRQRIRFLSYLESLNL